MTISLGVPATSAQAGTDRETNPRPGILCPSPAAYTNPVAWPAGHAPQPVCELTRSGPSSWRMTLLGVSREFKRCDGLGCLAHLTPRPERSLSALDVYCSHARSAIDRRRERHERGLAALEELKSDEGLGAEGTGVSYGWSFHWRLDRRGVAEIKAQLRVIEDELEVALELDSPEAQERLLKRRYDLLKHLEEVVKPNGSLRRMPGDPAERARTKVKNAINRAYERLQQAGPEFGPLVDHLKASVRTGLYCVYQPKPPAPRWIVSP